MLLIISVSCTNHTSTLEHITIHQKGDGDIEYKSKSEGTKGPIDAEYTISSGVYKFLPHKTAIYHPVDGVFIGVGNYDDNNLTVPTPAHTLGAVFAYELFVDLAGKHEKKKSSGGGSEDTIVFENSRFELDTGLSLNPIDKSWKEVEVEKLLMRMGYHPYVFWKGYEIPKDNLWKPINANDSLQLTKLKILEIARHQAKRLSESDVESRPVAIFYIASHGKVGADGNRYIQAADSVKDDLTTWISYQEILDIFASSDESYSGLSKLIFFDTCLTSDSDNNNAIDLNPSDGLVAFSSTAPGEYSWHWTIDDEKKYKKYEKGHILKQSALPVKSSYFNTVSVLPLAMGVTIRAIENSCSEGFIAVEGTSFIDTLEDSVSFLSDKNKNISGDGQKAETFFGTIKTKYSRANTGEVIRKNKPLFVVNCEAKRDDTKRILMEQQLELEYE